MNGSLTVLKTTEILECFPMGKDFRFIDGISEVDDQHIKGHYDFRGGEFFYAGHFPGFPVTPGVILTEVMAQIGLVAFGMHLTDYRGEHNAQIVLTDSQCRFRKVVYPGERVTVCAEKIFFRMNKLKVKAELFNGNHELAATAVLSGMILQP